jgi:pimeloyl-ACP methyl ester carboxylesterase
VRAEERVCDPVRLHVEEHGRGPLVVLAHGFGGSARNFRLQARAVADRYRTVAFDARGHARSAAPDAPEQYRRQCFVEDFARVIDESGAATAVLGGLSMGAGLALSFALTHPERVRGLVLAAFPRGRDEPEARAWALGFARAIEERGVDAAGAEFVWGPRSHFDVEGARWIRQGFLEHAPHALAAILRELLATQPSVAELRPDLERFDRPTLVVVGAADRLSRAPSEALARALPRGSLVVIEGAGHVVNLAAPGPFNAALEAFLVSL